ncbi:MULTISPECIES: ABC transporter substrate-binding protein [Peptoniphilus]|uniref:ABC transporter substrate-binding protein n=1 Tax=Peptoniphilus TaxID=162289 RepID=UPI002585467B|nr:MULTISPECIES: ABC transporter substrate-binding protein [Peptoniphilus]MDU1043912.1 ABC transporter substrate-binding protein [Peptoniphilus rhinitidis]MDU3750400.1 ABC transporter substrate-binding protein [Peptoniphilus rhinitidis]MDU5377255.1 ABC transporter substrate-binding protein [Peptoniphilus lacydonensis]MDU5436840.1 ABC transporter substrate-binding protein [Peptoniphilus lacydonensis]MDU7302844.1 ABC transporter substrate-binding protein [Peptoniphilus lacydonensis]
MKFRKAFILVLLSIFLISCGSDAKKENGSEEKVSKTEKVQRSKKIGVVQIADHIALERARKGFEDEIKKKSPDVEIISKNANGDLSVVPSIIKSFKDKDVDLIYAIATPAAQGAKNGVKDIPIIFNAVTDPESADLVKNLEEPEENVTGVSDYFSIKAQLEEIISIFPDIKTVGVMFSTNEANSKFQVEELKKAAIEFDLDVAEVGVNNINDVSTAIKALEPKMDIFMAITDNTVSSASTIIAESLKTAKIPSFASEEGPVENGILMSAGVDYLDLGKKAAEMASEVIDGKKVSEVPVLFSTDTRKVVNKKTAEALGLDDDNNLMDDAKVVE